MIIDVHTHVFPDHIALDVVPKMAAEAGIKEALDGRASSLLESMDRAGVDVSWFQPVATKPTQLESVANWMEGLRSDRFVTFGAFHPDYEDLPGYIRNISSRGFPGIKVHPEYQKIKPDDESLFPMYETLIEENMIVLFHAGLDIGIPTLHSAPDLFAGLIERFPDLKMILAHMGGYEQWEDVAKELAGRGKDVYLDTSYVLGHIPDKEFVALARAHGLDRVVFGTDSPWEDQKKEIDHLRTLPFSPDELDGILGANAKNLLNKCGKESQ